MNRKIFRSLFLGLSAGCLLCLAAPALSADGEEGPTVKDLREKIQEQLEEAEKEEAEEQDKFEEDDSEKHNLFWELLIEILKILFVNSATVRYADYPYAAKQAFPFGFQAIEMEEPGYSRLGYVNLCLDGAYLLQDRWGAAGRLSINVLALHLHGYTQVLFDPTGTLAFYSANAGLTLPSHRFILNLFVGVFGTDLSRRAMFSFGANAQIFLPGKFILDVYNINAAYHSLNINYLSVSLNYALAATNLGVGFNLNHYAGTLLMGPLVRISFWL
jgi:hypothetical protein